jgi:hypothetical protein
VYIPCHRCREGRASDAIRNGVRKVYKRGCIREAREKEGVSSVPFDSNAETAILKSNTKTKYTKTKKRNTKKCVLYAAH